MRRSVTAVLVVATTNDGEALKQDSALGPIARDYASAVPANHAAAADTIRGSKDWSR